MINVIAIDPGGTTGIAYRIDEVVHTTITGTPKELYELVEESAELWSQVVIEDFISSGQISAYGLYTLRLIGGIECICLRHRIPLAVQQPQYRYSSTLQQLQHFKDHPKAHAPAVHERDALMHLFAWEEKHITHPAKNRWYNGSGV